MASTLCIELYQKLVKHSDQPKPPVHYVRVLYDRKPVALPICSGKGIDYTRVFFKMCTSLLSFREVFNSAEAVQHRRTKI